mmetsp:Transcript_42724/g.79075  ORF Transcript_42724/g.79075 Transcript_42724/m.79075 type:complete len:262 (-) Transcript_42724:163-948(-)
MELDVPDVDVRDGRTPDAAEEEPWTSSLGGGGGALLPGVPAPPAPSRPPYGTMLVLLGLASPLEDQGTTSSPLAEPLLEPSSPGLVCGTLPVLAELVSAGGVVSERRWDVPSSCTPSLLLASICSFLTVPTGLTLNLPSPIPPVPPVASDDTLLPPMTALTLNLPSVPMVEESCPPPTHDSSCPVTVLPLYRTRLPSAPTVLSTYASTAIAAAAAAGENSSLAPAAAAAGGSEGARSCSCRSPFSFPPWPRRPLLTTELPL